MPGNLANYDVYLGFPAADWAVSPEHKYHVERFWSLSVEGHGGHTAFIGEDLETLFARAGQDVAELSHSDPLRLGEKIEMLAFAPDTGAAADLYSLPVEPSPAPVPVWQSAPSVEVGITWDIVGADLDLYVRPKPEAAVIYFNAAQSPEGQLFKDFTTSPGTGFETVALTNQPLDLSQMDIAINYYGGATSSKGVQGELRIAIDGKVWARSFHIPATMGNQGLGVEQAVIEQRVPNSAWLIVDPLEVLAAN